MAESAPNDTNVDLPEDEEPDNSWRPKFIPLGFKQNLNPDIYKSIFYSTSTADSLRAPMAHSKSTPILLQKAIGQNVQGIHDPNYAAAQMKGGFKPNRAPLYQRSMCAYTTQFVPRPLDGAAINRECYNLFKEKTESTSLGGAKGEFRSETTTGSHFGAYTKGESEKAIPPNFKPVQEKHISAENKLLVTKSAQHKDYPCPSVEHTKTARPAPFKPKYKTHKSVGTLSGVSAYKREYHADKYNSVWPVRFAKMQEEPGATNGYTGKLCLDESKQKKLVPEDFAIGDVLVHGVV